MLPLLNVFESNGNLGDSGTQLTVVCDIIMPYRFTRKHLAMGADWLSFLSYFFVKKYLFVGASGML